MDMLLLNAFKGLKKKKLQMISIIIMVMLSTGIFTMMNSSLDRLEDRYYHYLETQQVEDFSFQPVIDYENDISIEQLNDLRQTKLNHLTDTEKKVIDTYGMCLSGVKEACTEQVLTGTEQIFTKYLAYTEIADQKLDKITKKYQFHYQVEESKVLTENHDTLKAIPYEKDKKINIPYLVKGKFPTKSHEITVLPKYAETNQLEIGDSIKIGKEKYKIVGYAYAPDHIYPMLSISSPIFDEKHNNIMYMSREDYEIFQGIPENVYVAKFNFKSNKKARIAISMNQDKSDQRLTNESVEKINQIFEEKDILKQNINTILRVMRTDMIQMEFDTDRTFASAFLYLLLVISTFIILMITKKRIENERLQIGVLKSLGYRTSFIATSYLVYPVIGSIIGGVLGYGIGLLFNEPLTRLYLSYFNVPISGFQMNFAYLITSVFVPFIVLSILSYLIAMIMLRKKPLELLKEGSNLKVNLFSKFVSKVTKLLPFTSKFRYSLASRSLGKLFIVTMTSFCTGMLIVLILIGSNLFQSMLDKSFGQLSYEYVISYTVPQYDTDNTDDLILNNKMNVVGIKKNNKLIKNKKEDYQITLNGLDSYTKYIELKDENHQNLIPKLYEQEGIILNENVKETLEAEIGDVLVIDYNNTHYEYPILGVTEEYIGNNVYISREELSKLLGFDTIVYNQKYSKDKKYADMSKLSVKESQEIGNIMNFDDLERNIKKQMQLFNSAIYVVIFFASFMALVIISVIANIVVEENKKTISLMKVMGYKNDEISSVVLNIYTPFVIIAYLLSIPAMISILKAIVKILTKDTNMSFPIEISPFMAIVGLISLVVSYYIAIYLSRRALNKVPLAEALKRE